MAFCTECGSPIRDDAKFCFQCGTPAHVADPDIPKSSSQTSALPTDTYGYVVQSPTGNPNGYIHPDKKESVESVIQQPNTTVWEKPAIPENIKMRNPEHQNYALKEGSVDIPDENEETNINEYAEEDDDEYDFSKHDFDAAPQAEDASSLSNLSTAKHNNSSAVNDETQYINDPIERDPATDPFYDSIMPEIDNELYQIPKDIFIKSIGVVAAIVVVVTWLLFVLS